jgi:hypothetical protein
MSIVVTTTPQVSSVVVTPANPVLAGGESVQFSAVVSGLYSPPQTVLWTALLGTVSVNGLYTAPPATNIQQLDTVVATSTFDGTKSDSSTVTVKVVSVVAPNLRTGNIVRKYEGNVVNDFGAVVAGAQVTMLNANGSLAQAFKNSSQQLGFNPIITDSDGYFSAYLFVGHYSRIVEGYGITTSKVDDIVVGDIIDSFSVANLPAGNESNVAYAINGCKMNEAIGAGTGVPVYYSHGNWYRYADDAVVHS